MAPVSHNLADYWSEIQGSLTDVLLQYQRVHPEMIQLMNENDYFNTQIRNVLANGWVRGHMAAAKALDHCLARLLVRVVLANSTGRWQGLGTSFAAVVTGEHIPWHAEMSRLAWKLRFIF